MLLLQDLEVPEQAQEVAQKFSTDSVQTTVENVLREVQTNPEGFWHSALQDLTQFGLKVVAALVIYLIGMWIIRYVKRILNRIFERKKTEHTLASFITSLVSIMLTVMLILATIGTLGVDTTSFAALLAAGGMAVGMALSGTVQNFAGGIMLLLFRPFKSGDYIRTQGQEGYVMQVTIVSTKILTLNNKVVILPNGNLFTSNIENLSAQGILRIRWNVSVSYGVDAKACKEAMMKIMQSDPRILNEENYPHVKKNADAMLDPTKVRKISHDPSVIMVSLNSSDITLQARGWVYAKDYLSVEPDIWERFYTELPPQGFTFAYPHVDLNITHPIVLQK